MKRQELSKHFLLTQIRLSAAGVDVRLNKSDNLAALLLLFIFLIVLPGSLAVSRCGALQSALVPFLHALTHSDRNIIGPN